VYRYWMTTLLTLMIFVPPVLAVDVQTTAKPVYFQGTNELAGSVTVTVDSDAFAEASATYPVYVRIDLSHDARLGTTLVDPTLPGFDYRGRPVYLALALASEDSNLALSARADSVCIQRWVEDEGSIWLKIQQSSSQWLSDGVNTLAPTPERPVQFQIGLSARASATGLAGLDENHRNLPFNTRDVDQITKLEDSVNATSTLLCLNLSASELMLSGSASQLRLDFYALLEGPPFNNKGKTADIEFLGETIVAQARDRRNSVSALIYQPVTGTQPLEGLATITNMLTLVLDSESGPDLLDSHLHDGTYLDLSIAEGLGYGFDEKSLRFRSASTCGFPGLLVPDFGSALEIGNKTLYRRARLTWHGGIRELTSFLLELEATVFARDGQVGADLEINWSLNLVNAPPEFDEAPYDGVDQAISCTPTAREIGSGTWLMARLEHPRLIPHVTVFGQDFSTIINMANAAGETRSVTLTGFDQSGGEVNIHNATIGPKVTENFTIQELFGTTEVSHFRITGDPAIKVAAIYQALRNGSAPVHVSATDQSGTLWILNPGDTSLTYDGLVAVNLGKTPTSIRVVQLDAEGFFVDEQLLIDNLAPRAKGLFVLSYLFQAAPSDSYEIHSDQPVTLIALRGDHDSTFVWENPIIPVSQ